MERMTHSAAITSLALALIMAAPAAHAICGTAEGACTLPDGSYELVLPSDGQGAVPAVMFLHGHGGSARGVLSMRGVISALTDRGYAVIAPNGARRAEDGPRSWSFLPTFGGRDDFDFLPAVLADAGERFNIDAEHSVLAGFSSGAFMVNYLACERPDSFAAYLPVSGGFWRQQPEDCAGPVRLYQSHGWTDGVVPLEGRILGGGRFIQGDIWAGLELWRETLGCATHAPDRMWQEGELMLRSWSCHAEADLTFELFPGGHMIPQGWADRAINWLEASELDAEHTD
ncbi:PHB depolymerase family esterase [Tritonibacter scottomollicae]|uniref:PHB depolymerase family esterase n=2 Tax=Tritonibacter scottomollicae TaxID=483013 RepID=A0ABZ0HKV9_TRISK|nr:PHB depolymerase family esterase [Tritonibacter scottomollicae]